MAMPSLGVLIRLLYLYFYGCQFCPDKLEIYGILKSTFFKRQSKIQAEAIDIHFL